MSIVDGEVVRVKEVEFFKVVEADGEEGAGLRVEEGPGTVL